MIERKGTKEMRSIEVLVLGGGASGMMAAIMAAREHAHVMILEKKNRLGKKLLATGNGRCNFTNKVQKKECYRGKDANFAWNAMQHFSAEDAIEWFDQIGILATDKNGYMYPAANQATVVLHALENELKRQKVEVKLEEAVLSVQKDSKRNDGFVVTTDQDSYIAKRVIVATGGMAAPVHGSTGDGYELAAAFGHQLVLPASALTSIVLEGNFMKKWSGIRIQGEVFLYDQDDELLAKDRGEIQMVAYGISGIPVFQVSRFAAVELQKKRKPYLVLDSMPDHSKEWIVKQIVRRAEWNPKQSFGDLIEGLLPDKLGLVFLQQCHIDPASKAEQYLPKKIQQLAQKIKHNVLTIKEVSGFEKAQVTAGGLATGQVDPDTMESKLCKGLYFTGELLDIDGICGGYNLQWAWTSGYLAGKACGMLHKERKEDKKA
jgi:predicted Rossmann fold flavoprotein